MVHANGGNARVAKTVALNTLHSGPAVAARGAAFLARQLRLDHVVTMDMGGTSLDVSVIAKGAEPFNPAPSVDGVAIAMPMIFPIASLIMRCPPSLPPRGRWWPPTGSCG